MQGPPKNGNPDGEQQESKCHPGGGRQGSLKRPGKPTINQIFTRELEMAVEEVKDFPSQQINLADCCMILVVEELPAAKPKGTKNPIQTQGTRVESARAKVENVEEQ